MSIDYILRIDFFKLTFKSMRELPLYKRLGGVQGLQALLIPVFH